MSVPAKTGVSLCSHCSMVCKNEEYQLSHKFIGEKTDVKLVFCSNECLMEHFEEELFLKPLEAAIRREVHFLSKRVCPACTRRITQLE